MSWLTPIGFLGLIGLVILIIIYIIKPNYQNKIISSTFVWKLSLKYKKNKIPISKLINALLFICQVLVITACAFMLAQPFIDEPVDEADKKVYIIDASASMMTESGGITRFERAVESVRNSALDDLEDEEAEVSIILAHDTAYYLLDKADYNTKYLVNATLDELIGEPDKQVCTFGTPDINGAIKLSEQITSNTPNVEVLLYTDSGYIENGNIKIIPVVDSSEWNAAILDTRVTIVENKYNVEVDLACYGLNREIPLVVTVNGKDAYNNPVSFDMTYSAFCDDGVVNTIEFSSTSDDMDIKDKMSSLIAYSSVYVRHEETDSFEYDNSFSLYGGTKPTLRIQYSSAVPNNYFSTALFVLRDRLKYRWNIEYKEVQLENEEPALEGFDIYIFEHAMPEEMPSDGVVILVDPDTTPLHGGYTLGMYSQYPESQPLEAGEEHPILNMINPNGITLTKYTNINNYDLYTPILMCNDDPVLLVKDEPDEKVVLMPFKLQNSNLPVVLDFPLLMYNIIEYYLPSTVSEYVFDVNETIALKARGEELSVVGVGINNTYTEFPAELVLTSPGVYTLTQTPISGEEIVETFYVKLPAAESDINAVYDSIPNPYFFEEEENTTNKELLFYFALALVSLLFVEWWLHTREHKA